METNDETNDETNPGFGDCRLTGKSYPTYSGSDPHLSTYSGVDPSSGGVDYI